MLAASRGAARSIIRVRTATPWTPRRMTHPSPASGPVENSALYFGAGAGGGGLGSLVGLGGGFVIVPVLTGFAKFSQHQAHGTSLACVASCSIAGASAYGMDGALNLPAAAIMAAGASLTASKTNRRFLLR
jgi:uncharacterized membrane protein YfcA